MHVAVTINLLVLKYGRKIIFVEYMHKKYVSFNIFLSKSLLSKTFGTMIEYTPNHFFQGTIIWT